MSETFDQAFRDHQNREADLDQQEDERRAAEVQRQIAILEPFYIWLAHEIPASVGATIFHDYENAFFQFGPYYVGAKGDECVCDDKSGIIEWIYQRFLEKQ